jgi:hypothetical protein
MAGSIIGAAIGAGAGLIGSKMQSDAAGDAAATQYGAAMAGIGEQRRQYDTTRKDQLPFIQAGQAGVTELARLLGVKGNAGSEGYGSLMKPFSMEAYEADPGYAFRVSEGMKALERSASAKGGVLSGAALKGVTQYGQDMASQEYMNAYNRYNTNQTNMYNRLAGISGTGQNSANTMANVGSSTGANISELYTQGGNASAAGQIGQANAWQSGFGNLGNTLGTFYKEQTSPLPWQAPGNVNPLGGYY